MAEQERHILFKLKPALSGDQVADASDIEVATGTNLTGLMAGAGTTQVAIERMDATGIGAPIFEFNGNYSAAETNRNEWFNNRSNLHIQGSDGQANARRTFDLPGLTALGGVFDDLAAAGMPETFTLLISYLGGTSNSVFSNQLRVQPRAGGPGIREGLSAYVLTRGDSVTLQISRNAGVIETTYTELSRGLITTTSGQTLNDIELQTAVWNNTDGTFLPSSDDVLKGYAFRVANSNPNDGSVRQSLVDNASPAGSLDDRVMYDGDWVVWTGNTFTGWSIAADWFVLPVNDVRRLSQMDENFLATVEETDRDVDIRSEADGANDALVWITNEDVNGGILSAAPFLTPTNDTTNNAGGNAYIGGRELQNQAGANEHDTVFQSPFGNPLATGLLYIAITTSYISSRGLANIYIQRIDFDGTLIAEYSLQDNFNADIFTANSTGRYFVYSQNKITNSFSQVRVHSGETFRIITRTQDRHFSFNPTHVNVNQNISDLEESRLSQEVQAKLNRETSFSPQDRARLDGVEVDTESSALPSDFQLMIKFGSPSHVQSDYRQWQNDNGLIQDYTQTNLYTVVVPNNVQITGTAFTGTGTITITEITPSLFDFSRTYTVSIPPAPDDINYDILDHPITFTGTLETVVADGLSPTVKVDADNFEQTFLDSILNHNQPLPAALEALNHQAEVFHFDNVDFTSNNDNAGIESMFSFVKLRPDERLGDGAPTDTDITNEITNSDVTATIDAINKLFYPRTISGEFDDGVSVTTNGALTGAGIVNGTMDIAQPNAENFRLTIGMWLEPNNIPENVIRNLIRVKETGVTSFRRLFGLEGYSRVNSSGQIETGALLTERILSGSGGTTTRTVTHNLYTTSGEIQHTFSGTGAAETLYRVYEARTYTFEARLFANGNDEGSDTVSVTISNINQSQDLGQHTLNFTADGFPHSQVVNIEYVASTDIYGGPDHTLRFELNGGLTDNANFDIDHLLVSCHYDTTETVTTAPTYAEANAGGTALFKKDRKQRVIFSFSENTSNRHLQAFYVLDGFDANDQPTVQQSGVVDFNYPVFDLDWSQIRIGNTNELIFQNVQGFFLNTDAPASEYPTQTNLVEWLAHHDDKATDYVWDNADAPETDIEAVRFPENVVFPNQIMVSPDGSRWEIDIDNSGSIVTTKII